MQAVAGKAGEGEDWRVLFVDGEHELRVQFAETAGQLGFAVDVAESPDRALQLCDAHSYPVVVTDLQLPEQDGATLVRAIAEVHGDAVFVLTTREEQLELPDDEVLDRAIHSIIQKPWTTDKLANALRSAFALARSKGTRESEPRRARLLLIEDEDPDADLVTEYLEDVDGFSVTRVSRLSAAVERLGRESFDVVLTDLSLPDGRGVHVVLRLRELSLDVPIVVLTGLDEHGLAPLAFLHGAQDFLLKSELKPAILKRTLRRAIDHQRAERGVPRSTSRDGLTGLTSRGAFKARIGELVAAARNEGMSFCLLVTDIARFRNANAALGHDGGDLLLSGIAARINASLMDAECAARLGGDEFGVVSSLILTSTDAALFLERTIAKPLAEPFNFPGCTFNVTTHTGVAVFPEDGETPDALLTNAEAACSAARERRQHYVFYESEMNRNASSELHLESRLRKASEQREFVLHYQPKVELATGSISGLEALLRWQEPNGRLVPPNEFIPVLERSGLILDVGDWILEQAGRQFVTWQKRFGRAPRVAINVSAAQLATHRFVDSVRSVLRHFPGVEHGLELEITESLIMENLNGSVEVLNELKRLGLRISIDDFGTGYSSLGYLSRLPIDAVKIDRSFIRRFTDDPRDMTIVTTILTLVHSLNLKVIAEGVETTRQAQLLRLLKCDEIQGFLISKPMPEESVEGLFGELYEFGPKLTIG